MISFRISILPARQPGTRKAEMNTPFWLAAQNAIKEKGRIIGGNDGNLFSSSKIIDPHRRHNYAILQR